MFHKSIHTTMLAYICISLATKCLFLLKAAVFELSNGTRLNGRLSEIDYARKQIVWSRRAILTQTDISYLSAIASICQLIDRR